MTNHVGTLHHDRIRGDDGADYIDVSQGGRDVVLGKGGNDIIDFGAAYTFRDKINGGPDGSATGDTVILDGDYSAGAEFTAANFRNVETLQLQGGSYRITGVLDSGSEAGNPMLVDAMHLAVGQSLDINVAAAHGLTVYSGAGDDNLHGASNGSPSVLAGANGDDVLIGTGDTLMFGQAGVDRIVMGGAGDICAFQAGDSVRGSVDTIENFEAAGGRIYLFLDSNTATPKEDHDFHPGKTPGHAGDILTSYNEARDLTTVKVFTDSDSAADLVIHITGHPTLTPADFIFGPG